MSEIIEREITQGIIPIGTPKAYQYNASLVESAVATVQQGLTDIGVKTEEEKAVLDAYTDEKKSEYLADANTILQAIQSQYGYPFVASTVSAMTDTSKIYVYTGSESGYTAGNWYYNNGSAWVSGGTFNSTSATTLAEMSLFGVDDLLWDNANFDQGTTNTSADVTYTADLINKTVTVSGTSTGTSFFRMFYDGSTIMPSLEIGKKYIAHIHNPKVFIQVWSTNSNNESMSVVKTHDMAEFVLPNDCVRTVVRLDVDNGVAVGTVSVRPFISEAPSLGEIGTRLGALEPIAFVNKGSIHTSTDLDTIKTEGYYFISNGHTAHSSNPLGDVPALLCVYTHPNNLVTQIICGFRTNRQYVRFYNINSVWSDWYPFVADADYMKKKANISANTDFNTLTETGFSYLSTSSNYVNSPLENSTQGILFIYNNGTMITQIVVGTLTGEQYVRRYYSGTDAWSNWASMNDRRELKVLVLGHSTVQDNSTYVPFLLQSIAPELSLTMGLSYSSGAQMGDYINFFDNDTPIDIYSRFKPNTNLWSNFNNSKTVKNILLDQEWDVIILGESAINGADVTHWADVGTMIDKITNYLNRPLKFGLLVPQNRYADNNMTPIESPTVYSRYVNDVQEYVLEKFPIQFLIPGITAYWNARGTTLDQYGNATWHHMLYDYTHYQEGIGCYVGGLTTALKLLEVAGINDKSVMGEQTRPDEAWVSSHNIPGQNGGSSVVGISDANCLIAQKCAIMSVKYPFEIKTIY